MYQLDNVVLSAASLVALSERTVELTLNGQQFGPAGTYGYQGDARFPTLVDVSPSSGPIAGGTILRLAVANVDGNLSLPTQDPRTMTLPSPSTSAYRCFLGGRRADQLTRASGLVRDDYAINISATYVNDTLRCATSGFEGLPSGSVLLYASVSTPRTRAGR